jgi:hypothetical protein
VPSEVSLRDAARRQNGIDYLATFPPPNGCGVCGADKQGHCQRHGCGLNGGFGGWQHPSTQQRLERMLARRLAARPSNTEETTQP